MKKNRQSLQVLCVLYLLLAGYLIWSAFVLPERVASHFDADGRPNGWMHRSVHLILMAAFGFVLPLLLSGVFRIVRHVPVSLVNIPNRDYWLTPERREEAFRKLSDHSLWFACLMSGFSIGMNHIVVQANLHPPPRISGTQVLVFVALFALGVGGWVIGMIRLFRIPTKS